MARVGKDKKELIAAYEEEFLSLRKDRVIGRSRTEAQKNQGLDGESKVRKILEKYASDIRESVVVWNRRRDMATEMDFVAVVNGYLVIAESKDWFGTLERSDERPGTVWVKYSDHGKPRRNLRTDPLNAAGGSKGDLLRWLGPDKPDKGSIRSFVVFTRKSVTLPAGYGERSNTVPCSPEAFEEALRELSENPPAVPYELKMDLPSWDYYRNDAGRWYTVAVLTRDIGGIPAGEIDSVLFEPFEDTVVVKTADGRLREAQAPKGAIRVLSTFKTLDKKAVYLKLDPFLNN